MDLDEGRSKLVNYLERNGFIRSPDIREAFLSVRREHFIPSDIASLSYEDTPLPIGEGQTISAPSMIAIMLEVSDLGKGMKVLEVGAGSGYNACLLAHIVGSGNVTSIERIGPLLELARSNLRNCPRDVELVLGDGTLGYEANAPYDRIIITAASPDFPSPLIGQLKVNGKIIAPIGRDRMLQRLKVGTKAEDGNLLVKSHGSCVFVPLIGKFGF
ncbi:MAG: protein-L-isoaspartate(D-aspartate) O-methyltransferase [Candidatus Methanofastidiosa archaeon]|nr:protein-L-isoaspartate(D-aspartate) O-methyltransferase [Candidatus Methanofastidiosa archaeon]